MKTQGIGKVGFSPVGSILLGLLLLMVIAPRAWAGPDPAFAFYGYQEIIPNPNPSIVGENTHFTVTVENLGDEDATNVTVQLSYNDWGVTYMGWQPIGSVTVPLIAPAGTAVVEFNHIFLNRTHTCIEALITDADQNDDPTNDRGQINMEVIHSGESFEYNVPIVNNGDEPLLLHLEGHCAKRDAAGTPDKVKCVEIDQDVEVPAGEQILIPVRIDFLPGTPAGTAVDFVLDAYYLPRPNDAATRNHVVLRVVYNSARNLKMDCLARLNGLPPGAPAKSVRMRIDAIKNHIATSLDPGLWIDDFRLRQHAAGRDFAQEQAAAIQLLRLLDTKDVPLNWKSEFDVCARSLADADRILAQTAINDAGGNAKAEQKLQEADQLREAGNYPEVIKLCGQILAALD